MSAWIEKRIFLGASPPSLGERMPLFDPWRFSILNVENTRRRNNVLPCRRECLYREAAQGESFSG